MKTIKKQKSNAFNKDIYLIGKDKDGVKYWLEAPSWDCGYYWGFGYVETYTNNNNPSKAKDITSHQHLDSLIKYGKFPFEEMTIDLERMEYLISKINGFYSRKKTLEIIDKNSYEYKYLNSYSIPLVITSIIDALYPFKNYDEFVKYFKQLQKEALKSLDH